MHSGRRNVWRPNLLFRQPYTCVDPTRQIRLHTIASQFLGQPALCRILTPCTSCNTIPAMHLFRPVLADHSPWHTKRVHLLLCVGLGSKSCWKVCACSCSSLAARSNSPRRKVHVCLSTVRPRSWDVSKGSCEHQAQYEAPSLMERLAGTCTGSNLASGCGGCGTLAACHIL